MPDLVPYENDEGLSIAESRGIANILKLILMPVLRIIICYISFLFDFSFNIFSVLASSEYVGRAARGKRTARGKRAARG